MTRARDLADFNLDGKAVTINESSADLDFRVESNGNANMLFVDAGNDKVGIGTSSPTQALSIGGAASGTVALQVTNSTAGTAFNDGMQMFINDSAGGLNMRENYPLQLYVNGSERMRVASDGKVGINTTAPNLQTSINFDTSAVAGLGLHDTNSGNLGGMLQFYSGSGQGTLRANIMNANNAGVHMAVGTGGSVVFTQNSYVEANALDDYEEGTFTPVFQQGLTSAGYSTQTGTYIKIGRQVICSIQLRANSGTENSSHIYVGGLPFTITNDVDHSFGAFWTYNGGFWTSSANTSFLGLRNTTNLAFYKQVDGGSIVGTNSDVAANLNADLRIVVVYRAD